MSFADACLVRMSELIGGSSVLTLDSDFYFSKIVRDLMITGYAQPLASCLPLSDLSQEFSKLVLFQKEGAVPSGVNLVGFGN